MAVESDKKSSNYRLKRILNKYGIDFVLDIGANTGQYALKLRHLGFSGQIVSIEPQPTEYEILKKCTQNDAKWQVFDPILLGAKESVAEFYVHKDSSMSSTKKIATVTQDLLGGEDNIEQLRLPMTTLDNVSESLALKSYQQPLMKCDTQGNEFEILKGAEKCLACFHLLQLELSLIEIYDGEKSYLELLRYLEKRGFIPILFIPGYFNDRLAQQFQFDAVFARKDLVSSGL